MLRATRLMPELSGLSYRERLVELNLSTLGYRWKRFDIIQVFKIIHKNDDLTRMFSSHLMKIPSYEGTT